VAVFKIFNHEKRAKKEEFLPRTNTNREGFELTIYKRVKQS